MFPTSSVRQFLGIRRSVTGFRWRTRQFDESRVVWLSRQRGLSDLVSRILVSRDVTLETVDDFLEPKIRTYLPDPYCLKDMEAAATRLATAVQHHENIAIIADYDVDGATSAALLTRFLRTVTKGITPRISVPNRITEGYGLHPAAVQTQKDHGISLLVAVDCGTTAFKALELAQHIGIEVIVLDHHTTEKCLPPTVSLVNPQRPDDTSGLNHLCSVGIVFLTLVAVNRLLRQQQSFSLTAQQLLQGLDLVALGTLCDIMPIIGLNRAFVFQGLRVMEKKYNTGLSVLMANNGLKGQLTTDDVSFVLGPLLNAGGRVGASDTAVKLLITENLQEAQHLAHFLQQHNKERKKIQANVLTKALKQIDRQNLPDLIFVVEEEWHPGVVGLIASRLSELFHRPACVVGVLNGIGHGSGRSVQGFDLGARVLEAVDEDILLKGGGHTKAAGFSVSLDRIEELKKFLTHDYSHVPQEKILDFDGVLTPATANMSLLKTLQMIAPFGEGNPEPLFALAGVEVLYAAVINGHVRVNVSGSEQTDTKTPLRAIAFRAFNTPLGDVLLNARGRLLHLAGFLRFDRYTRKVQLFIKDAAYPTID